jgi:N-methylhydantoinase B
MDQRTEAILNRTVIMNRLDSITKEMGIALEHSAHSPIFA